MLCDIAERGAATAPTRWSWSPSGSSSAARISQRLQPGAERRASIFDGRNLYDPAEVEAAGLAYYGIGRGRSIAATDMTASPIATTVSMRSNRAWSNWKRASPSRSRRWPRLSDALAAARAEGSAQRRLLLHRVLEDLQAAAHAAATPIPARRTAAAALLITHA